MRYVKEKSLLFLLSFYLFASIIFQIKKIPFFTNFLNPLFWLIIIIYLIIYLKKIYVRFPKKKKYFYSIIIISLSYILLYFYLGFIFGFSKSPYSHSLINIFKNIFQIIVPIVGIELSRSVILNRNKNNRRIIIFATILFILLEIKYSTLINNFANKELFFIYICQVVIPTIAGGMLYSYLSLKESYRLPLIYRLLKELELILLPIIPTTDWFIDGSIGILVPVIIFLLYKYVFSKKREDHRKKAISTLDKIGYAFALIVLSTLVAFMLGLFKYEPIAILSNSMYPSYSRGDVVVYEKLDDMSLKNLSRNSIIIYRIGNQYVAHRIVDVISVNGTISYRTEGDNNNAPDVHLVNIEQIKGVYRFHIKYVGFPSVWLHDYFNKEDARVETK